MVFRNIGHELARAHNSPVVLTLLGLQLAQGEEKVDVARVLGKPGFQVLLRQAVQAEGTKRQAGAQLVTSLSLTAFRGGVRAKVRDHALESHKRWPQRKLIRLVADRRRTTKLFEAPAGQHRVIALGETAGEENIKGASVAKFILLFTHPAQPKDRPQNAGRSRRARDGGEHCPARSNIMTREG